MLQEFFDTFTAHGLEFDLTNAAKTSVFTRKPLPQSVQRALSKMNVRCQTDGIAPCKCPTGTTEYMEKFMNKVTNKLQGRFHAFDRLLDVLLRYDANRRTPTRRNFEHYLNLVRLSFLSMPTYTLRAVNPTLREHFTKATTTWAASLISRVFPPTCSLPDQILPASPFPMPQMISFSDLLAIAMRIMELPLSMGGLSCRLPRSINHIAFVASCIDCEGSLRSAAHTLGFPFKLDDFPGYSQAEEDMRSSIPNITKSTIAEARASVGQTPQTTQQLLTKALNEHEITAIAAELEPYPIYHYAWQARTDPRQDHAPWPLNPKTRIFYDIGPLEDAQFSRHIQISTLRPVFNSARRCEHCRQFIDPVGLHLLNCQNTHYTLMHETVKRSLAHCLRNLFSPKLAALSVHVEAPVIRFVPLRHPNQPERKANKADIVLILSGQLQQDVFITDIVSALAHTPNHRGQGFYYDLAIKERDKRSVYYKYGIPDNRFFALAFGRTNVLSRDTLRFCETVGTYFPQDLKVEAKIRACFSRAIASGVAATFNEEMRRMQLAILNSVAFSMVPPAPDQCAKRLKIAGSKQTALARPPILFDSLPALHARFDAILSRDDSSRLSAVADEPLSQCSVLLSQQSEENFTLKKGR